MLQETTTESTNADVQGLYHDLDNKPDEKKEKPKTKPAKPKPVTNTGPIYLLLQQGGKYKELSESELQAEASAIFKDPTLRLVKAQFLIPELSFKVAE